MNSVIGALIILAAHHDDELLWFEPWMDTASEIVIVMPTIPVYTPIRNKEQKLYSTKITNLWGKTTNDDYSQYWLNPQFRVDSINYHSIKQLMRKYFNNDDNTTFVTHNPWGEYGHYHHKIIYRVARDLAIEYKKTLWVDNIYYNGTYTFPEIGYTEKYGYDMNKVYQMRSMFQKTIIPGTNFDTWTWGNNNEDIPGYHQSVPYSCVIYNGEEYSMSEIENFAKNNPLPDVGAP